MKMKSSNPAFSRDIYDTTATRLSSVPTGTPFVKAETGVMTINGTIYKSFVLAALALAGAYFVWSGTPFDYVNPQTLFYGGMIGGFVCALGIIFKPTLAPTLAPVYALLEGVTLGMVTLIAERSAPGIATQALLGTFGTLASFLLIYRLGIIKVTERLRMGILSATMGIAMVYLIDLIGGFFGYPLGVLQSASTFGVIISVFFTGVAAFNLLLDFDSIEQGARAKAPKHMEWYGAFGLLVTLVWLYLEMLRLLSKLSKR